MVYIVGGLPGAGKSTHSKKLAKENSAIVFSTDVWMSDLFWMDSAPGEDVQWALERTGRVENRMVKTCIELNKIGTSSILDIGFVNLNWRKKTYAKLDAAGVPFEVHFLEVDRPTRWERVQKRNSEQGETFSFEVTKEMLDFMDQVYDPIEPSEMSGKLLMLKN
ncbi:MAG: ATP-binding protein [Bdellovibrionales bacterium]|nr:ATP-binding protein [Bdellovibrionales bacterium]